MAKVPPHLVPSAIKEATELGTKFANLSGQLDKLKLDISAAKTGDEVANAFVPVATALGSNAFAGTHRLAPSEVEALGPHLGSIGRQLNTMLDKAGSGTLPDASIKEFSSLVDRLSSAATSQYQNGLRVVNQNYGSAFTPVQMQPAAGVTPQTVRMRAPNGQEKDVPD